MRALLTAGAITLLCAGCADLVHLATALQPPAQPKPAVVSDGPARQEASLAAVAPREQPASLSELPPDPDAQVAAAVEAMPPAPIELPPPPPPAPPRDIRAERRAASLFYSAVYCLNTRVANLLRRRNRGFDVYVEDPADFVRTAAAAAARLREENASLMSCGDKTVQKMWFCARSFDEMSVDSRPWWGSTQWCDKEPFKSASDLDEPSKWRH